jgi:predicted DNA-binding transcriptional regulator AlpA
MNIHQSKLDSTRKLERLLDEREVAVLIGVKRTCMQSWRLKGGGPRWIAVGRLCKYREADVLAWLDERTRTNTSQEVAQ